MILLALLAQLQALPPQLVALDSDQGRKLLTESAANRDFFALVGTFTQQKSQPGCALASSVAALNALSIEAPVMADLAPFRGFTQDNVFSDAARAAVFRGGATIDQLAANLRTVPGVEARPVFASETTLDAFRADAVRNLASGDDYLLVDFLRSELGQDFGAHWSPVAAYHAQSDRFLVLDVNRVRYPPYWAHAADLFRAMNTSDLDSGKSRGYVVISKQAGAPARVAVPPLGHRLVRFAAAAVAIVFSLGALAGGLFVRWRLRRGAVDTVAKAG